MSPLRLLSPLFCCLLGLGLLTPLAAEAHIATLRDHVLQVAKDLQLGCKIRSDIAASLQERKITFSGKPNFAALKKALLGRDLFLKRDHTHLLLMQIREAVVTRRYRAGSLTDGISDYPGPALGRTDPDQGRLLVPEITDKEPLSLDDLIERIRTEVLPETWDDYASIDTASGDIMITTLPDDHQHLATWFATQRALRAQAYLVQAWQLTEQLTTDRIDAKAWAARRKKGQDRLLGVNVFQPIGRNHLAIVTSRALLGDTNVFNNQQDPWITSLNTGKVFDLTVEATIDGYRVLVLGSVHQQVADDGTTTVRTADNTVEATIKKPHGALDVHAGEHLITPGEVIVLHLGDVSYALTVELMDPLKANPTGK